MKIIKLDYLDKIPNNYTGIVEYSSGTKEWLLNGKRHREDGPAVEFITGYKAWYLDGKYYSENKYKTEMAIRNSTLGKLLFKEPYFKLED